MNKENLIWSSLYDEWLCEDYMDCRHCEEGCISYDGNVAYDLVDDIIMTDLNEKFGENDHQYFAVGIDYINYYGLPQNMNGHTDLYDNVKSLIFDCLYDGGVYEGIRIYKGKRNSIIIERTHHDGREYYQLCRLNKQGREYYDNNYNINFTKYLIKGVFNDFNI